MTKRNVIIGRWWVGWVACAASMVCGAQSSGTVPASLPGTPEQMHTPLSHRAVGGGHKRPPISLAQTPVVAEGQPGTISLQNGTLTIHANDSELSQILGSLTLLTGMAVKGVASSDRVFGVYGPGAPKEVLTQLLSGFNYNFLMAGVIAQGLPRELLLNARSQGSGNLAGSEPLSALMSGDGKPDAEPVSVESGSVDGNRSLSQPDTASSEPLGPGAIAHVPPNEAQGSGNPQDDAARVQQSLQRLQHIQERQSAPPQ